MSNSTLMHWGILGQKWGVRRYQNPDGTLTEAGKRRYSEEVKANHQKPKKNRVDDEDLLDPGRWVRDDTSNAKRVADSAKTITNDLSSIERSTRIKKQTPRMDLSEMSDTELRNRINREMLEKQYNSLFNEPKVSKGRETVETILAVGGGVLGVTSSALGIALAINELRGSKALPITKSSQHLKGGVRALDWPTRNVQR